MLSQCESKTDSSAHGPVERVLECAEAFARRKAVTVQQQRQTMEAALRRLRLQLAQPALDGDEWPAYVHLPLVVYSGLPSTTLLFLGLDLFDGMLA